MGYVMTAAELAEKAIDVATNYKTLYVMAGWGGPLTASNKTRYINNKAHNGYNARSDRKTMINAATDDTFAFDCVCFIKGLLWGWCGDKTKTNGGATYASNGVPDLSDSQVIAKCSGVSTTGWKDMAVGEAVWMSGHIGLYVGDGLAVEASPAWQNKVQITAVGNIGAKAGYNTRTWTKHGKLPWVDYTKKEDDDMVYYKTMNDVPKDYKPTIQKLVNKGALKGTGGGELNVSDDFCRTMTVLDRLGKLD